MTFMFTVIAGLDFFLFLSLPCTAIHKGDVRNALRLSEDDFKMVYAARG